MYLTRSKGRHMVCWIEERATRRVEKYKKGIIQASGAETDVFGTTGRCEVAREEVGGGGGGGGEQHPQNASFRLLKKMAGRLRSELGGLGAFMM